MLTWKIIVKKAPAKIKTGIQGLTWAKDANEPSLASLWDPSESPSKSSANGRTERAEKKSLKVVTSGLVILTDFGRDSSIV